MHTPQGLPKMIIPGRIPLARKKSFCVIFIHFSKILHACVLGYYPLGEACQLTHSSTSEYFFEQQLREAIFIEFLILRKWTSPQLDPSGRFLFGCPCLWAKISGLFWPKMGAAPNLPAYGLFRSGFSGRLVRKCSEYGSGGQDSHPNHDGQCPKSTRRNDG